MQLPNRPGKVLVGPLAVGDDKLLLGENGSIGPEQNQNVEGLILLDTVQLDRVVSAW